MPEEIVKTQIRPLLKEQPGQFLHCLLRQGKVDKIRCVKGRLEVANYSHADRCKPRSDHSFRKGLINVDMFC